MSAIELREVSKRYGATTVLDGLDLTVPDRSITVLLGASGSGKTTTLRLIAGFDHLDTGSIAIGGQAVDDGRRFVRPQHRHVGYVAQDGALFPHLTVAANITFGVRRHHRGHVSDLIELVGLGGLERRYPHQLSGGQQQRVALARALAVQPNVVLLDEPFGSLDSSLRDNLRREVVRILTQTQTTTVLVTHDQDEALGVADQIAVIHAGRVVSAAPPRQLYHHPTGLAAATTIGDTNILPARLHGNRAHCLLGDLPLCDPTSTNGSAETAGHAMVRPEQIDVRLDPRPGALTAVVIDSQYHGHDALVRVKPDQASDIVLLARTPGDLSVMPGQRVWIYITGPVQAWPEDSHESRPP
jgi:iron(III) transport system ATP-binding protein